MEPTLAPALGAGGRARSGRDPHGRGRKSTGRGISPLLANASLPAFDVAWETKARGAKLIRDGDDSVILGRGTPPPWFQRMERIIPGLGLTLTAEQRRIVDAAEGLDCLGRHCRLQPMPRHPTRRVCDRGPSTTAMQRSRQTIREAMGHEDLDSLDDTIRAINPLLRGWGASRRISNAPRPFQTIDSSVSWQLVHLVRRQHTRRGKGVRECPPSCFQRAGRYRRHGTLVRGSRRPRGARGRTAECGQSSWSV